MKIAIFGCGYVGCQAALFWKQKGYILTGIIRNPAKQPSLHTYFDDFFLFNDPFLKECLLQQDAILISVAPTLSSDSYQNTYLATAELIKKVFNQSEKKIYILYTSSTSVYQENEGNWVNEDSTLKKESESATILQKTEEILLQLPQADTCIFRLGEIYGPNRQIKDKLSNLTHALSANIRDNYTNIIHLKDIARALDFALCNNLKGIYNLCNDFHQTRLLFYEQICKKNHLTMPLWDITKTAVHSSNKRVSNQKIKQAGFVFLEPQYRED